MYNNFLKKISFVVITFLLALAFGQSAVAADLFPSIKEVTVDIEGSTVYILGNDFNTVCPPVVLLGANPTPLTLLSNNIQEITVALPDVPNGDYLLQVGFPIKCFQVNEDEVIKYYTYNLTIGGGGGTPMDCPVGQFATGISASGALKCQSYGTYIDRDADTYSVADGDCNDHRKDVHPNKAHDPFMSSPHNASGSYDWNCDGIEEKKRTQIYNATACRGGWQTSPPPSLWSMGHV